MVTRQARCSNDTFRGKGGEKEEEGVSVRVCLCVFDGGGGGSGRREAGEINISATWPLKPLPMTANIMKRYGRQARGERNEKDKKRTVK